MSIGGQVQKHLFHLALIGGNRSRSFTGENRSLSFRSHQAGNHAAYIADHICQIQRRGSNYLFPPKSQQLLSERGGFGCGSKDLCGLVTHALILPPKLKQFCMTADDSQDVVEVVRYASGKPAYRFHLLRHTELIFQPLLLRDITHHAKMTARENVRSETVVNHTFRPVGATDVELSTPALRDTHPFHLTIKTFTGKLMDRAADEIGA